MSFRSPHRRGNGGLVLLSIILVILGWLFSAWVTMLFVGNMHHAGFPFPAISYDTSVWMISPIALLGSLVGGIFGGSR